MSQLIARISFSSLLLVAACVAALVSISACRNSSSLETHAAKRPSTSSTSIAALPAWNDSKIDGIPDGIRLRSFNDRENFRRWFTAISELQFYHQSETWKASQRDCAGLVRFAMREALREHNRQWFQKMSAVYDAVAPDVRAFSLERNPLGEKLFRTKSGAFTEADLIDGTFSEFADARTLKDFNSRFISRDRREALPGDLLFFYQPWAQKFPYHVMIFLGKAYQPDEDANVSDAVANDWVVYHTGASPTDAGTIKKVRLSVLDDHPDKRWRPVAGNRNFLGFYRLKILQ